MHWQIPLILSIIVSYFLMPYLIKKIAGLPSRSRNLAWQYFFTASFATIIALVGGAKFFTTAFFWVMIVGAFNAFGCYCQWRAVDINLSKTSLFTQADDFIALLLGYLILHEASFLNPLLGLGIIFCLGSAFIFVYNKWRNKQDSIGEIAKWVAYYSIIWGIAKFSMRYFALNDMQLLSYVAAWYEGSLLGACTVFALSGRKEKGDSLRPRQIIRIIPLSLAIMTALMLAYWTFSLAPIIVVQPIKQVSEMIFPTIVGLWIFKEIKQLNKLTRIAMVVGLVGGIIIMFSFR